MKIKFLVTDTFRHVPIVTNIELKLFQGFLIEYVPIFSSGSYASDSSTISFCCIFCTDVGGNADKTAEAVVDEDKALVEVSGNEPCLDTPRVDDRATSDRMSDEEDDIDEEEEVETAKQITHRSKSECTWLASSHQAWQILQIFPVFVPASS
jgi:hypothetical protein